MSNPLPSSARSALRERVDAMIALAGDGADGMLPLAAVRDVLSLAERGAEMIRVTPEEAAAASDFFSYGATRGNHRDDGLVGPGPLSGRVLAMNILVNKLRDAVASSPTGGTTE